jgi:magnesium transporter
MTVHAFQINEAIQMTPLAPEKAAEAVQGADARIWLDLQGVEPGELEQWLDTLGIKDLSRRRCLEGQDCPAFYPLKTEILLVIPVLTDSETRREAEYVAFLCRENLLLTVHRTSVFSPEQIAVALKESDTWLPERSIAGLVSSVMIDQSETSTRHTVNLRRSILALEERMDREPDRVEAEEILDLRAEMLALGVVVGDQLPGLQALSTTDKPFFRLKDAQEYMNSALANLQAAVGSLRWLDQRVGALRAGFEMHAQDKTNRRLGMLTILSAIFMPVTLLAGIWGMNFESMPELKFPSSYPIALGFMALVGWGMHRFFRKGGWFD